MTTNLHLELIRCLVNQPGIDINARGFNGKTPLHCAIELDELSLVDLLLTKKNINPFVEDNEGKTSLDYAKDGDKTRILQALINNKYGSEEDSLLHLAAMMGEINAVKYLIRRGVDVNSRNALHHTPLHLAAGIGHVEIVEVLVKEGNAEIDVFDARNQTPMHYAVNNKKLEIVKLLLKLGADVNAVRKGQNSMKLSPLHNAVSNSNYDERDLCLDIVRCLINASNSKVNLQDYEKRTPLHYADRLKTIETLLTREDIDPLIKDDNGKTQFCYAKEANKLEIVKVLVGSRYGPERNSLLHLAAQKGYVELIDGILKEKIDVNVLNNKDQSPIYLAAENGHLNVVKLLLKRGANPYSSVQLAINSNNLELLKALVTPKNIRSFENGNNGSSPVLQVVNKCVERRKTADRKIKKYNNIISVSVVTCAIVLVITYANPAFAVIIGVIAIVVAVVISDITRKYIEDSYQKEMAKGFKESVVSKMESTDELEDTDPKELILNVGSIGRQ